jgi:phospholipase C
VKLAPLSLFLVVLSSFAGIVPASAQTPTFQHIVVVVQENRTPDNLFYALCAFPELCSTTPTPFQYNIQTRNWVDKSAAGGVIQPLTVELANAYDLNHAHQAFQQQCNLSATTKACSMDGGAEVSCTGTCPTQPSFRYVDNSTGILDPYLDLIKQYGWANYMFQTNQGPSFPAHQFIFGGTSAPTAADDAAGIFADSNVDSETAIAGCIAAAEATVSLVSTVSWPTNLSIRASSTTPCPMFYLLR